MRSSIILKWTAFLSVAIVCFYFFAQWKLKSNLDQFISKSSENVEISYDSARVTLAGTALVRGSSLLIPSFNIQIAIEEVEFSTTNIIDLLFGSDSSEKFNIPEQITLRIDNANLPLSTTLVSMIKSVEQPSNLSALEASGCGQKTHLGIDEYLAMGYKSVNVSGDFTFDKSAEVGNIISKISGAAQLNVADMTRFSYQFELSNILNDFSDFSQFELMPTLDYFSMDITDLGYNFRKNTYCAEQEKTTIASYTDNHIKLVADALKSAKLVMSDDIKRTYKELLQPGSTVHFSISPQNGFNFESLLHYNEQELREALGLELKVNNFDLPTIFDGWQLNKFDKVVVLSPKEIAKKNSIKKYKYYLKPLVNAKRYLKKQVKIIKPNGVVLEGRLDAVNKESLRLLISYKQGTSEGEIDKDLIASFYVYL